MKKSLLKLTALLLYFPAFSAFAEQTVDIDIRGIRGNGQFATRSLMLS
ncbi:Uncharacterised protein [Rodentibacter pneumotropicus]|uniref:Uncharacterized protein n=1 Tax=Rodentibacter pneumotropicus TaxID=758 RepID=A0A3S4VZH8_9PAST|nr:Uncharacterised protein [Rodentibacter pneumotropicus]